MDLNREKFLPKLAYSALGKEVLRVCRQINDSKCIGCQYSHPSQLRHECVTETSHNIFTFYFDEGLKVIVSGPNEQLDVDLEDMQSLSKDNDGIKYLLVAIDVFSRYAWVEPLKNKTAKEVERGLISFSIRPSQENFVRTGGRNLIIDG